MPSHTTKKKSRSHYGEAKHAKYDINGKVVRTHNPQVILSTPIAALKSVPRIAHRPSSSFSLHSSSVILAHGSSVAGADRRFRALVSLNQRFVTLRTRLGVLDKSGFIALDVLYEQINKYCAPFSLTDFKLLAATFKVDEGNCVDLKHFFSVYNPVSSNIKMSKFCNRKDTLHC